MGLLSKEGFLSKAKWMFSSISGIMLWVSRLSSPTQVPRECFLHQYCLQPGLKTLVYSQGEPPQSLSHPSFIINSYMISSAPSSPSSSLTTPSLLRTLTHSSSWSSAMDDLIGAESGVYINSDEEETSRMYKTEAAENVKLGKRNKRCERTREYPPPIPLLARTGNLLGHMPWVLTRHYGNGKLVLKEERVKHHEYFEAYRENGRLILNLVLLDDTITYCHTISEKNNVELELEDLEFNKEEQEKDIYPGEEKLKEYESDSEVDHDQEEYSDNAEDTTVVDETTHKGSIMILASQIPKTYLENEVERYGTLRKCFTYTGRKISDTNLLCNASAHQEPSGTCFGQSGSAPLAFSVRPMTTVM